MPSLKLPIPLDMEPMLSAPGEGIPQGDSWEYEPKWDGFRTLVFRDGELIVVGDNGLDFGALQQRIHPADSRVRMLSEATPAWYVAFDILAEVDTDLRSEPLGKRRKRLEALLKGAKQPIFLTPFTRDFATAEQWFEQFE